MPNQLSAPIIVFDVNETLLDLTTIEPLFARVFGDAAVLRRWFAELILYSQSITLSGLYAPFGELATGSLRMMGSILDARVTDSDAEELKTRIANMPAHADVVPALKRLREAGFRLVTLTNSATSASPTPLEKAGINDYFERGFSVEAVQRFKPAPETYHYVAAQMGVETTELCLVACHLWDTIGAQAAGCTGAFIGRAQNALLPVKGLPVPDFFATELTVLAEQIIQHQLGSS